MSLGSKKEAHSTILNYLEPEKLELNNSVICIPDDDNMESDAIGGTSNSESEHDDKEHLNGPKNEISLEKRILAMKLDENVAESPTKFSLQERLRLKGLQF